MILTILAICCAILALSLFCVAAGITPEDAARLTVQGATFLPRYLRAIAAEIAPTTPTTPTRPPPTPEELALTSADPKVYGETITTGWRLTSESCPPFHTMVGAYVGQDGEDEPMAILARIDDTGVWRDDEGHRLPAPRMWAPIPSMSDALRAVWQARRVDLCRPSPDDDNDIPL